MGSNHPKPVVFVTVVRIVPVAVGAAHVPTIVVERAAPQDASLRVSPSQRPLRKKDRFPGFLDSVGWQCAPNGSDFRSGK